MRSGLNESLGTFGTSPGQIGGWRPERPTGARSRMRYQVPALEAVLGDGARLVQVVMAGAGVIGLGAVAWLLLAWIVSWPLAVKLGVGVVALASGLLWRPGRVRALGPVRSRRPVGQSPLGGPLGGPLG